MTSGEKFATILIDAALGGIDRVVLQSIVRDGEAKGLSQDEVTAQIFNVMKDHGIRASIDIAGIP